MATEQALNLAREIAALADSKKAESIVVLDVSEQHSLIECFVLATAQGPRLAQVIGDLALRHVRGVGEKPWHIERSEDWVCGDFGDVVLHVFTPDARDYYDLDHLWSDSPRIEWTPLPAPQLSAELSAEPAAEASSAEEA